MNRVRRIAIILGLVLLTVLLAASASHVGASCLVGDVPTDFVLPDGSKHPAGALRVCLQGRFNPAIDFRQISVAGNSAGLYQGKAFESEGERARRPVFYFRENTINQEWVLLGLTERSPDRRGELKSIRFVDKTSVRESPAPRSRSATRIAGSSGVNKRPAAVTSYESVIVVAAR
jgi:hypothetical protein